MKEAQPPRPQNSSPGKQTRRESFVLTVARHKSRPNRTRVDTSLSKGSISTNVSSMRYRGSGGRWIIELRMNLTSTFPSLFLIKTFFCDAERRGRRDLRTHILYVRYLVDRVARDPLAGWPRPARPGRSQHAEERYMYGQLKCKYTVMIIDIRGSILLNLLRKLADHKGAEVVRSFCCSSQCRHFCLPKKIKRSTIHSTITPKPPFHWHP